MPRADRTYTARDIVRFWENNLDRREQEIVLCYFCKLCDNHTTEDISLDAVQDLIIAGLSLIPIVGPAIGIAAQTIDLIDIGLDILDTLDTAQQCIAATRADPELIDVVRLLEGP